jgi:para-aminobenzoate synthetase component 1
MPGPPAPPLSLERLPALDGIPPADAADAFRDLPGLALLESARPGRAGRWSFLAAEPVGIVEGSAAGVDPFAEARGALARLDATPLPPGAPPLAGGLVGYLGYDAGRRLERLPARVIDDQGLPDLRLVLHAWAIAWDGRDGRAWLAGRAVDGDRMPSRGRSAAFERAPRRPCVCPSAGSHPSRGSPSARRSIGPPG